MTKQLELFNKSKKQWEDDFNSSPSREYNFDTISGEPVDPLYIPQSPNDDFLDKLGFPGQFPYTRGVHANMYRGKLWTKRQFSGFGTPEETNARYHSLLEKGLTGLSVAYDMPTLMGMTLTIHSLKEKLENVEFQVRQSKIWKNCLRILI